MPKQYPQRYAIVDKGQTTEITAKDPTHEAAIILSHREAMRLTRSELFDHAPYIVRDTDQKGE